MDECKLGLHDCDMSKEKCVNVPGGFECQCNDGYRLVKEKCTGRFSLISLNVW